MSDPENHEMIGLLKEILAELKKLNEECCEEEGCEIDTECTCRAHSVDCPAYGRGD